MRAVSFTPAATRQWLKLSADIRKRIDAKLTILCDQRIGQGQAAEGRQQDAGFELAIGGRVIFIE